MREFFGLILLVILLGVWNWVFADSEDKTAHISSHSQASVEQVAAAQPKI